MKYLILITLLTSCAITLPEVENRNTKKKLNHVDQMKECVVDLVGRFGETAKDAEEVCSKIYRRK